MVFAYRGLLDPGQRRLRHIERPLGTRQECCDLQVAAVAEYVHAFALVADRALALNDSTGYLLVTPGDVKRVAAELRVTMAEAESMTSPVVRRFATEAELTAALPTLPPQSRINWVQPRRQMDPCYWQAQKLVAGVAIVAVLTFSAVRLLTRRWRRRRVSASAADTA